MYLSTAVFIVNDIVHTDVNILYEFFGIFGIDPGQDIVDCALREFQRLQVVDILALASEAGLI